MEKHDLKFMEEAITWADDCHPIKESIPKVGAVIAIGTEVLGRGRRGTGKEGDDKHAEQDAISRVEDKSRLTQATLYTTLEPCTGAVRSKPLECCTELIRQHQIRKVFVGILDPNEGVTGKGLLRLQESGVEVVLFPHELSKRILAQNAPFSRSQQTLGATIIKPKEGEELRTHETSGKHSVRFKSLNPPGSDTYLLIYSGGLYWPQPGPFRQIQQGVWEIDAHFGSIGEEHVLQLVTANDLGSALIRYYRKVIDLNRSRRQKLRDKIDESLLGGDYPGIEMNGLPKGIRLEATVTINIAYIITIVGIAVQPETISLGKTLEITYEIACSEKVPDGIWLGASFQAKNGRYFFNTSEDKTVQLTKGKAKYVRSFTIAKDAPLGEQMLRSNIWQGQVGDSAKSKRIASGPARPIRIID